jgi:two-component sensor histidine kinase
MPTTKESVGAASADGSDDPSVILCTAEPAEKPNHDDEPSGREACAVVELRAAAPAARDKAGGKTASEARARSAAGDSPRKRVVSAVPSSNRDASAFAALERKLRELEARNAQLEQYVAEQAATRQEAEQRQNVLAREVDHRARNTLAVIQSIIRLTRAKSIEDYVQAIEGRIKALARAHTLLSDTHWNGADLASLVADELGPYRDGDRIHCAGPCVSLQPAAAQGLALALHELATNAVTHGALSSPYGMLHVAWALKREALTLTWIECGGPAIVPPVVRNFGLKIVIASIERQLGGRVVFDWDPEGLRCEFSIPRHQLSKADALQSLCQIGREGDAGSTLREPRPRVLLVEDEALVALMIQDTMAEFGFDVLGPVGTVSEALAAARDQRVDAAVLDINLGDDLVYTVAEILARRGVPFAFVTGYDPDSIDPRFSGIPVLRKPIERESLQRIFVTDDRALSVG